MQVQRFKELAKWDLIEKISPVLHPKGPYKVQLPPKKIGIPDYVVEFDWEQPWVHIKRDPEMLCKIYTDILVNCLNVIPERCLNCWKVVFRPQFLKDMDNLIPVMKNLANQKGYYCKLGAEWRPWTTGVYGKWGLWGAYFYNKSQKTGIKCWEDVKNAIAKNDDLKHLLDDVDSDGYPARLVLKRGCTEFEIAKFGDSKNWTQTEDGKMWEKIVWEKFEKQNWDQEQTEEVINHIKQQWYIHAHHAGDPTVLELNDGPLYPATRYYHKELFESVKKKRALEKSLKK